LGIVVVVSGNVVVLVVVRMGGNVSFAERPVSAQPANTAAQVMTTKSPAVRS
jgi:hypothetical protein